MMFPSCSDCEKVGLKRLGLYKSKTGEDVCDFHQYNPEPKTKLERSCCSQCDGEDDYHSENCPILKKLIEDWMMINE